MPSSIIDEFIQSLTEEIEAIRRGRGGSVVRVFNGRFLREISGLFVYVFNLENFLAAVDDSPAEIEIRGSKYTAQVLSTQGLEVEIGIEHSCGQFIPEATLQTNLWYLLELLKKKFSECQSGTSKMDFALSEVLFSGSQPDSKPANQTGISYSLYPDPPNEAQKQAIEASFSSRLSIIWGPPGTGKTKTVAKAIEAHLNAGRRVLLVSHANNAVDEALEDVAEHLKTTPFYQEGKLVRLGNPRVEHFEKLERDYPLVLLDNIAAKLGESLSQEKSVLENKKRQVEEKLTQFENAFHALQTLKTLTTELDSLKSSVSELTRQLAVAQDELNRGESLSQEKNALEGEKGQVEERLARFESAFHALQTLKTLTTELESLKSSVSELTRQLAIAQDELNRLEELQRGKRERLVEAQSAGALKRFFRGLDPQRIQRDIDLTSVSLDSKTRLVIEMNVRLNELKHSCQTKENEAGAAKREADGLLQHLGISASELVGKKKEFDQRKDTILARIAEINRQLDEIQKNILMPHLVKEMNVRLNEFKHSCQIKEDEVSAAKREADALLQHLGLPASELEGKEKEFDQQNDTILTRIAEINRQLDEIQKKVLAEAKLVATTLTKTFVAKQFPDVPFDVLVLDEASMAPLPHLYWAAGRCREFITIVGDFLQLPPICIADDKPMAQKWLGRSIFDVLGIQSAEVARRDRRVKLLDTQYRMVPAISAISNRFFYGGILRNDPSTRNRSKLNDGVSESPLVLVETMAMNPWCSRLSSGSRFNLYNALVCATLARRIVQNIPDGRIGIIAPYGPQARLINKIAKDWGLSAQLRISTVHSFQGGEEPIIIFDTTEGTGTRVAPMLDDTRHDSDARLVLNVAVTRAESRLYLVAHTRHLLAELHRDSALSGIIRHFQQEAETLESETLVDNYFTTDFEKWAGTLMTTASPAKEPVSGELFTERNFWAQFFQDLRMVKERLIILSPFISIRRSSMFMNYFEAMIRSGIEIRIRTRPIRQQVGEMANQAEVVGRHLRSIGAHITEYPNMHQKVAILDNSIAWEGSLNILSHRDTGEHMRRFKGPSAIEEIIRNLDLDEENAVGTQMQEGCPRCDGYLVVRVGFGRRFLGCSNYPRCRYTRPINGPRR